jgi:CPA2 family monovalent cation:H+ antiporter-2
VVDEGFYSAVIGGALITMIAMPILAKVQPRMFDTISRLTPYRLRGALSMIDEVHAAAAARNSREQDPALQGVRRHLSLIFVDGMIALVVVIVFTSLDRFTTMLEEAIPDFILLPQELLMLLLMVVMSPIVYNMFNNVRNIA